MIKTKNNFILILSLGLVFLIVIAYWIYYKNPTIKENITFKKEIQELKTQSSSDTVDSIEKDLNDTELNNIDKELTDIEKELNSTQ